MCGRDFVWLTHVLFWGISGAAVDAGYLRLAQASGAFDASRVSRRYRLLSALNLTLLSLFVCLFVDSTLIFQFWLRVCVCVTNMDETE